MKYQFNSGLDMKDILWAISNVETEEEIKEWYNQFVNHIKSLDDVESYERAKDLANQYIGYIEVSNKEKMKIWNNVLSDIYNPFIYETLTQKERRESLL